MSHTRPASGALRISVVLAFFALLFLLMGVSGLLEAWERRANQVKVNATVLEVAQWASTDSRRPSQPRHAYYYKVRFQTRAGDTIETFTPHGTASPAYAVGDIVPMVYLSANARDVRYGSLPSDPMDMFSFLIGAALLAPAVWIFRATDRAALRAAVRLELHSVAYTLLSPLPWLLGMLIGAPAWATGYETFGAIVLGSVAILIVIRIVRGRPPREPPAQES